MSSPGTLSEPILRQLSRSGAMGSSPASRSASAASAPGVASMYQTRASVNTPGAMTEVEQTSAPLSNIFPTPAAYQNVPRHLFPSLDAARAYAATTSKPKCSRSDVPRTDAAKQRFVDHL